MKKKRLWMSALMLMLVVLLCACGKKEPLSRQAFANLMQADGYLIVDATGQFEEGTVASVTLAHNNVYQLEFFEFDTEEEAQLSFRHNKLLFEEMKGSSSVHSSVSIGGYESYKLKSNGQYYLICRVDNTFVYCVAADQYAEEIDACIKNMKY